MSLAQVQFLFQYFRSPLLESTDEHLAEAEGCLSNVQYFMLFERLCLMGPLPSMPGFSMVKSITLAVFCTLLLLFVVGSVSEVSLKGEIILEAKVET